MNELQKFLEESGDRPMNEVFDEAFGRGLVSCNREFMEALESRKLSFSDVVFDFAARAKPEGMQVMAAHEVMQ